MNDRRDPHFKEVIDFLQPFIDGKVYRLCDLSRQGDDLGQDRRHATHSFCHDNPTQCACPCHWTEDEVAYKLIEILKDFQSPIVGTWLGAYMGRNMTEIKRLTSLINGREAMNARVTAALVYVPDAPES